MKRIMIVLTLMLMALSIVSSCKKSSEVDPNTPPSNPVEGVFDGNIAISFTETDSNGNPFTLGSFKGKVILLTFSAMWCGPCRREAPDLMNLYNTYKERGLEIAQCIFQDEDGSAADLSDLARWITEFGITFTVFNDPDQSTVDTYQFNAIPFNVLIDRNFIIRYREAGYFPDALRQKIEQLL